MARSPLKLLGLGVLCTVCELPAAQEEPNEQVPINYEADSFSLDRKSNLVTFDGFRLTYGDLSLQSDTAVIAAGLATDGEWEFAGNVRVVVDSALLEADRATFTFADGALARAELAGDPARFSDTNPERTEQAEGGADLFVYDYVAETLRLSEGAFLRVGQNQIRGCDLIYDFAEGQVMSGSSSCGERFSITIVPPADEPASGDDRSP